MRYVIPTLARTLLLSCVALSPAAAQEASQYLFRATASVIESPAPSTPVAGFTTPTATASVVNGVSPGSPASLVFENGAGARTGPLAIELVGPGFAVVEGGTCSDGASVASGGRCTILVSRIGTVDDAQRQATVSVGYGGAEPAVANVAGTVSGFAARLDAPATATASITNGVSPGPGTLVEVRNAGKTRSGTLTFAMTSGAAQFAIAPGGTCVSGTTQLAPDAACTIAVARTAVQDEVTRSGRLTVTMNAAQSHVQLSGTASGFPDCAVPGTLCSDGTAYVGTVNGSRAYVFRVSNQTMTMAAARTACQARGTGWDLPINTDNNTYHPNLHPGFAHFQATGLFVWTRTKYTGNNRYNNHNTTIRPHTVGGSQAFGMEEVNTRHPFVCIKR